MTNQTANYYGDVYQWNRTVSTDGQDTPTEYYLPNWTDLVLAGLFTMLIIVTIVGNTLVIIAVITTRRLRSVTNCFVSSLAAADLLVGLAVMPPAVVLQVVPGSWARCSATRGSPSTFFSVLPAFYLYAPYQ
ncbi:beta-3 adrenergic receptor-like isoform X2 [Ceratina calcarata]|uniref:Beta-3 adrenergic receptor-like isoform X2 n=1 Tax=Ceratina calcarata TaxID=156304 RepID=A0AAJ7N3B3_9HYME|nr:beta-3 adrenergic receptor-like isoform X2 [Ceratina calcarata]